jgi:hypothetical protein
VARRLDSPDGVATGPTEVHGGQLLHIEGTGRTGPDDRAELHEHQPVRHRQGVLGVLLDQQHRRAPFAQLDDGPDHLLGGQWGQPQCRFVGHEDLRRLGQGRGQPEHLLLPAGQQPRLLAPTCRQHREPGVGALAVLAVPEGQRQVLLDGEPGEDAPGLGDEVEPGAGPPEGGQTGQVLALEMDHALGRFEQTGDHRAQGRLPGPVGSEQGDDLAGVQLQPDTVEHLGVVVAGHHGLHGQDGIRRMVGVHGQGGVQRNRDGGRGDGGITVGYR